MTEKKVAKKAPAKANGNITVDLGEAIDRRLKEAMKKGAGPEGDKKVAMGSRYSPGLYGWRPFGGDRRPGMSRPDRFGGSIRRWTLGEGPGAPLGIHRSVNTMGALSGVGVGIVLNRGLMRATPSIIKTSSALAHSTIAFVVGVIPALIKQNSVTLGVAVPGAVYLGGSIIDWAMDSIGISRPALSGAGAPSGVDRAIQARQRLVNLQSQIAPTRVAARRVG